MRIERRIAFANNTLAGGASETGITPIIYNDMKQGGRQVEVNVKSFWRHGYHIRKRVENLNSQALTRMRASILSPRPHGGRDGNNEGVDTHLSKREPSTRATFDKTLCSTHT